MGKIEEFFDPAEFHVEFVPRADGDFDMVHTITGQTRDYLERVAAAEGMTLGDYIAANVDWLLGRSKT